MATPGKLPPSTSSPKLTAAGQLLLDELFEGQPSALSAPFTQWVATSKPYLAFAQKYLSKIRKKVRMSRDAEETYNLYCELRTASLLLQEPKFEVAYEPYGKDQGRSADFGVTFRTNTLFHVEVTRLRISQQEQQLFQQQDRADEANLADQAGFVRRYESRRLTDMVCDKFGQMSPDTPNVLWVWSASRVLTELDVGQVMVSLKRKAEDRDADLFARHGFSKPADLLRFYQRVNAVIVQSLQEQAANRIPLLWQNNDSKYPLPAKIATLLRARITADSSQDFSAV